MSGSITKDSSAFQRAVGELLNGAKHTHEVAEILVIEAVQETLARVCRDYPLDYTQLVKKYQADVVAQCCQLCESRPSGTQEPCGAITKHGKRCSMRAIFGGYCGKHKDEFQVQHALQRRTEAYVDTLARGQNRDVFVTDLQKTSKNNMVPMKLPANAFDIL